MSDFYASANGERVTSCSLMVPWYGAATAEITMASDGTLTGPVALVIGNLKRTMGIIRQAPFAGSSTAMLVGGAARWSQEVQIGPYENSSGVMLSTVLRDLAMATRSDPAAASTGERVTLAADRSLGAFYVPARGPAARVLADLAGALWWTDGDGVTQIGPRPTYTIRSPATVADRLGSRGWLDVATEDPASWMPGATYSGPSVTDPITVAASRFVVSDHALRVSILTTSGAIASDPAAPTALDRSAAALRAMIRHEDPRRLYHGLHEYAVAEADAGTIAGRPVDPSISPPLPRRVPYRPSLAGSACTPAIGARAIVGFVNGDPSRPFVLAFDSTLPDAVSLGSGYARVVREGDTYTIGAATGPLTFVSTPDPNGASRANA